MSKTIRHKINDKQYTPQNHESKIYNQHGVRVPQRGGRAYNGHSPNKTLKREISGMLRAKLKNETLKEIENENSNS